jgi:hypothetical protein
LRSAASTSSAATSPPPCAATTACSSSASTCLPVPALFGNRNFSFSVHRRLQQQPGRHHLQRLQAGRQPAPHRAFQRRKRMAQQGQHLHLSVHLSPRESQPEQHPGAVDEIPLLSQAVRVGGPSFTWIRDTATLPRRASRNLFQLSGVHLLGAFGSQADFNQVDVSNSSYYQFHDGRSSLRATRAMARSAPTASRVMN